MEQKPTMMNTEWNKHLERIDVLFHRINDLEDRVFALEHPEDDLEEWKEVTEEDWRNKILGLYGKR